MDNLSEILDEIIIELDGYEEIREKVIAITRELNRLSGRGIALLVMGKSADELYEKGKLIYDKLSAESHPFIFFSGSELPGSNN